jgi:hypothetical protein
VSDGICTGTATTTATIIDVFPAARTSAWPDRRP